MLSIFTWCPFLFSYILCAINSHHWSKLSFALYLHDIPHRWLHARHSFSPCARYWYRTNARINAFVVHYKRMISTFANVYNILEKSKEIGIYFWRLFVLLHILHFITIWEALFSLLQPSIKIDLSYRKVLVTRMLSVLTPRWKTTLKWFPNEDVRNSKFIVRILLVHFVFYEKMVIVAALVENSLGIEE